MARPLRIEYPGALYHVTARGNARADIYLGDGDRRLFLDLLAQAAKRHGWLCHAYCLMEQPRPSAGGCPGLPAVSS